MTDNDTERDEDLLDATEDEEEGYDAFHRVLTSALAGLPPTVPTADLITDTPQEAYDRVMREEYPEGPPTGANPADRDKLVAAILRANHAYDETAQADLAAVYIDDANAGILTSAMAHKLLEALLRSNGWKATMETTRLSRLIMRADLRSLWPLHRVCMTAYLTRGCRFGHEWWNLGDGIEPLQVPHKLRGHR